MEILSICKLLAAVDGVLIGHFAGLPCFVITCWHRNCRQMGATVATEKAWGTTETVYIDAECRVDRVIVRQGGYCSRHVHHHMCNGFVVVRGVLLVDVEDRDTRYLTAEDGAYFVPAGCVHHFRAISDAIALEIYRAKPDRVIDPADIHRLSEGGIAETHAP